MKTAKTPQPAVRSTSSDSDEAVALKLFIVLSRAYRAVTGQLETSIAESGLTSTEFGILEVLHHKGPLLLGEIQRKILVTSGGITYLVDRLVEKGLVKREECPSDRRARYAVLTPAGDALIRRIFPGNSRVSAGASRWRPRNCFASSGWRQETRRTNRRHGVLVCRASQYLST
jgi:MarR family 2-MHQ and catechol resistance regulon transcriptional repressor